MRFSAQTAQPVPWKNGSGVTRELASHAEGGRMVWRLSLAEISRDGPFSAFPGLARIHCIVAGAGHVLSNAGTRLEARLMEPLAFDGCLELDCCLRSGACKAFNVIYNPQLVSAEAKVLSDGRVSNAAGGQVVLVVSGSLELSGGDRLIPGEGIIMENAASGEISEGGAVIQVRFQPV
ncbi:HutD family protein [Leisingera sp. F5]|uniref:HutD/Ves family protein n=1 Tax=Leisingera sp. F5 TaxID=1813816 RepID=UPI000A922E16|nr:HutD family protein [Leisingera sp. F5]